MYRDFQEIKRLVSIHDAAQKLGLMLKPEKQQYRGICPSCNTGGDRALVLTPERGLFYCFAGKCGGDCLALVQHITGIPLQEAAEFLLPQDEAHNSPSPTPKQNSSAPRSPPKREAPPFDPAAFAARLEYTSEVSALNISPEEAQALGIGMTRGKLYLAMRYDTGETAGFAECTDGRVKLPARLLPRSQNVVPLRRPA